MLRFLLAAGAAALPALPAGAVGAEGFSCAATGASVTPSGSTAPQSVVASLASAPCRTDAAADPEPAATSVLSIFGAVSAATAAADGVAIARADLPGARITLPPELLPPGVSSITITVSGVTAQAGYTCSSGVPLPAGSSQVRGLVVDVQQFPMTTFSLAGAASTPADVSSPTTLDIAPGVTAQLNQTVVSAGSVVQRGLVVLSDAGFRAVLGEATAGATASPCPPPPPVPPTPLPPAASALAPAGVVAGSGAVTLIVQGSGFVPGSLVLVAGVPRTTTYVGSGALTAAVGAGDLAAPGSLPVSVLNPDGRSSAALPLVVSPTPPRVVSVSPAEALPGALLTVEGSGFGAAMPADGEVTVRGQPATVADWSDTRILAYAPNLTAGAADVSVRAAGLSSNALPLTVQAAPNQPPIVNLIVLPQPDGSVLVDTSGSVDPDGSLSGRPASGMFEHDLFNGLRELLTSIDGGKRTTSQHVRRQLSPGTHSVTVIAVPSSGTSTKVTQRVVIPRPAPLSGSGSSARLVVPAPRVPPANISIPSQVAFDFGSAELRPESQTYLLRVGALVRRSRAPARVLGYTDDTGDAAENQQLSLQRAQAVRRFLIARLGIPAGRLGAVGRGGADPVASNATELGRQRNRRVVLAIGIPTKPTVLKGAKAIARDHLIEHLAATQPPPRILPPVTGPPGKGVGIY